MKKSTVFTLFSIIAAALVMFTSAANAQAVQRVVVEEFTGAWCGWCPHGAYILEELMKKHPDQVLGVSLHYNDAMQFNEGIQVMSELGVGSFPSGDVSRIIFNVGGQGQIVLSRNAWEQASELIIANQPKAEVNSYFSMDYIKDNRTATVFVEAKFLQSMSGDLRFFVYVIEDEVTGSGSGYDQQNYLSNRSGYEDTPYYNEPSVIKGFKHMQVVRKFLGGPFGLQGSLPGSVSAGQTYTYSFETNLDPNWDLDKIKFIGALCTYNAQFPRDIINCARAVEIQRSFKVTSAGSTSGVRASGELFENTFNVENVSGGKLVLQFSVEKTDRTPKGWTAEIDKTEQVTLNDGESVNVNINLLPNDNLGIGDADLKVSIVGQPETVGKTNRITVISAEIERFEVIDDGKGGQYSLEPVLTAIGRDFFPIAPSDMVQNVSQLNNIKTVIWNCGDEGGLTQEEGVALNGLINSDKNVLLMGTYMPTLVKQNAPTVLTKLGLDYVGIIHEGDTGDHRVRVAGYLGDPITDKYLAYTKLLQYLYANTEPLPSATNVHPILKVIPGDSAIAHRIEFDNSRAVFLGLQPQLIEQTAARNDLFDKILTWLEEEEVQLLPEIAVDKQNLDFGTVKVSEMKSLSFKISNEGDADLEVTSLEFAGMAEDGVFTLEDAPSGAFTIAPGENVEITIGFSPLSQDSYTEMLDINSNDENNPTISVNLNGDGSTVGVKDGVYGVEGIFTVNVGPNPFSDRTIINYTIGGIAPRFVDMYIIDASGKIVSRLVNTTKTPGRYSYEFTGSSLSSGTYYLISRVNGVSEQTPIIINR